MLMHTDTLGVTTGEQRRAGGRANRRSHHEARELPAFTGDAVDIRRLDCLGAKTTQVAIALIIGEDDNKVGLGRL